MHTVTHKYIGRDTTYFIISTGGIQRQKGTPYTIIHTTKGPPMALHLERNFGGKSRPLPSYRRFTRPRPLGRLTPIHRRCVATPKAPVGAPTRPRLAHLRIPPGPFTVLKCRIQALHPPHKFPLLARSNVPTSENRGQSRVRDAGEVLYRRNNRPFPTIRPGAASVSGKLCPWWNHFGFDL